MKTILAAAVLLLALVGCGTPEKPKDSDVTSGEAETFGAGMTRLFPETSGYSDDDFKTLDESVCNNAETGFTYGQISKVVDGYTGVGTGSEAVDQIINLAFRTSCPSMAKKLGVALR